MVEITREHQNINVAEFISVLIYLAEESGKIIRQVEESGDLKTQEKGKDGPVTVADIRVQKTIESNLLALYPSLNI
jgi:3'-phosphoadenosine 5'-phosphosulfate (PAPS) 3'-phosphatase